MCGEERSARKKELAQYARGSRHKMLLLLRSENKFWITTLATNGEKTTMEMKIKFLFNEINLL